MTTVQFILYVADQTRSTAFYTQVLNCAPTLNVPGMTEFHLTDNTLLGLMPIAGIKRLLGDRLPDPDRAANIPRSEIYLLVNDPRAYYYRALASGALELSDLAERDWGHRTAYCLDPDGHVLAFAEPIESGAEFLPTD